MAKDLGDRMKEYEWAFCQTLPNRLPVILRIDGRTFHSYTKGCERPFDDKLIKALNDCAIALCKDIHGAQIAYLQSDEISVLIHNYKTLNTQPYFDNKIQKIVSISAAMMSSEMTALSPSVFGKIKKAQFDARVFVVPESDVNNYFYWRQSDWARNSIQMLARSLYSHKECHKKNNSELHEMCFVKGKNWNDLPVHLKRGRCIVKESYQEKGITRSKWVVDDCPPIFSKDKDYIEKYLETEKD